MWRNHDRPAGPFYGCSDWTITGFSEWSVTVKVILDSSEQKTGDNLRKLCSQRLQLIARKHCRCHFVAHNALKDWWWTWTAFRMSRLKLALQSCFPLSLLVSVLYRVTGLSKLSQKEHISGDNNRSVASQQRGDDPTSENNIDTLWMWLLSCQENISVLIPARNFCLCSFFVTIINSAVL